MIEKINTITDYKGELAQKGLSERGFGLNEGTFMRVLSIIVHT